MTLPAQMHLVIAHGCTVRTFFLNLQVNRQVARCIFCSESILSRYNCAASAGHASGRPAICKDSIASQPSISGSLSFTDWSAAAAATQS